MSVHRLEMKIGNQTLSLETGKLAKLADGAIVAKYGDTVILTTAVSSPNQREEIDFLPLIVDFQTRTYAAGKIPAGFFKREGRLGERETLNCRLMDRPLRPLFPKNYYHETQVITTVLSAGKDNSLDFLGINAASAALVISDIPFAGPIGAVRVGRVDGQFVINPDEEVSQSSDIDMIVAGTKDAVLMVEGGAKEVSEEEMLDAIMTAHDVIKDIVSLQEELAKHVGTVKREFTPDLPSDELKNQVSDLVVDGIRKALAITTKSDRKAALDVEAKKALEALNPEGSAVQAKHVKAIVYDITKNEMRRVLLETGNRIDSRKSTEIRAISSEVSLLPLPHGSALFTRGETQSLSVVTLGTADDAQRIDSLTKESSKSFMLHYNFPPFSVGEARMMRGPSRREIGHGALAERALLSVLPDKESFPYTIRLVSEILESNGSSSMATICAGSMALMDAGVPIKKPVSGVAMGLVKEGDDFVVLSDILGDEDHLGDMDFKVAGTSAGITALQMDMKIQGISKEILVKALLQAKEGRKHILDKMLETLPEFRTELSETAPRIVTLQVKQEKIREIIGPGGKVIKDIIARTGVKIDINDEGIVNIYSADSEAMSQAVEIVKDIGQLRVDELVIGKIYEGTVEKIADFGAFVEVLKGVTGLVHISQLADRRVNRVEDVISEGETIKVKVLAVDERGRIRLSLKEAMAELNQ